MNSVAQSYQGVRLQALRPLSFIHTCSLFTSAYRSIRMAGGGAPTARPQPPGGRGRTPRRTARQEAVQDELSLPRTGGAGSAYFHNLEGPTAPNRHRGTLLGLSADAPHSPRESPRGVAAASRGRGRRRPGDGRDARPPVHPSAIVWSAVAAPPVLGGAAPPLPLGHHGALRPAESPGRGDDLREIAAPPARSLSPYATPRRALSPPRYVGESAGIDASGDGQDEVGCGMSDDDLPLQQRLWASARPLCSLSATPGPSAGLPPWSAPELGGPNPLPLFGSLPPPPRRVPAQDKGRMRPPADARPTSPVSRAVADGPATQEPPPAAGGRTKRAKKVKTTDEKLDALSSDFKALMREWTACKGELVTVRSMLATLTGQVNAGVENGGHVLAVVKHIAEKPSTAVLPVKAAPVAPPTPAERPRSFKAQARLTMRWFKSLKVRGGSVSCPVCLSHIP